METGHDSLFTIRESPNTPDSSFYEGNLKKTKIISSFDQRFWHKKTNPMNTDPKFGKHHKGLGNNIVQYGVSFSDMRDLV